MQLASEIFPLPLFFIDSSRASTTSETQQLVSEKNPSDPTPQPVESTSHSPILQPTVFTSLPPEPRSPPQPLSLPSPVPPEVQESLLVAPLSLPPPEAPETLIFRNFVDTEDEQTSPCLKLYPFIR